MKSTEQPFQNKTETKARVLTQEQQNKRNYV